MTAYWVYMLSCDNDSYYTGYTTDLVRRYQEHVAGKCKYTRSFKPICIAQSWLVCGDKSTAMRVEAFIKKQTKKYKQQLILSPEVLTTVFSEVSEQNTHDIN
jgi:putative endonuclease